jgi:HSP20 family protein
MGALTPWTGMTTFRKEMDRLFDRVLEPVWKEVPTLGEWEPKLDMSETKDAIVVTAEIPGVDQKDIEVSLRDGLLTIKGEKQEEKEEKDRRFHRVERAYGAFMRAVQLPATVDAAKVTASFKNGVVTVTLPKTVESRGTSIPIKAA